MNKLVRAVDFKKTTCVYEKSMLIKDANDEIVRILNEILIRLAMLENQNEQLKEFLPTKDWK